jgi:hypothetical protein
MSVERIEVIKFRTSDGMVYDTQSEAELAEIRTQTKLKEIHAKEDLMSFMMFRLGSLLSRDQYYSIANVMYEGRGGLRGILNEACSNHI